MPNTENSEMQKLLDEQGFAIPNVGDLVEGTVISASKNEIYVDVNGLTTGLIRGKEIEDESGDTEKLKPGDTIQATLMEIENERGEMELSLRMAGHQKAWDRLEKLQKEEVVVDARVIDANKGGLMIKVGNVIGFLPVSQLTTENYPRVEGGDKNKILAYLKNFIGQDLKTRIIDVNEQSDKLIVSEKAAWEDKQKTALANYKVGDKVKGKITGVVDFGAFIEFGDGLEGLIHISELAWQRIDDPKTIVKVGDDIEAEIISIEGTKVSLSIKKLQTDPWKEVGEKYKVGDKVTGKVLKINPFGAFVELDQDIHGLAHVTELSDKQIKTADEAVEVGKDYTFRILSIEPKDHRLGLTLKSPKASKTEEKTEEVKEEVKAEPAVEAAEQK